MHVASDTTATPAPPAQRVLLKLFGFAFAAALLAISATMNWKFGYGLSTDEVERQLFGLASLAVDGMKAILPLFIIVLWRASHRFFALIALILWGLCFSWSMASAIGFSAKTREEATAGRAGQIEARDALNARERDIKAQLAALPQHRDPAVVRAELETVNIPMAVWRRTSSCTVLTREESRLACEPALALRRELAAAEASARLGEEARDVRRRLDQFVGIVPVADPQVQTLAYVANINPETVKVGLSLLLAVLVEMASAFGFTVVALATSRETVLKLEARTAAMLARERMRIPKSPARPAEQIADLRKAPPERQQQQAGPVRFSTPASDQADDASQPREGQPTPANDHGVRNGASNGSMNGSSPARESKSQIGGRIAMPRQTWG